MSRTPRTPITPAAPTPGPWKVRDTQDHNSNTITVLDGRRQWIHAIGQPWVPERIAILEGEANSADAALIAAAPELRDGAGLHGTRAGSVLRPRRSPCLARRRPRPAGPTGGEMTTCPRCFGRGYQPEARKPSKRNPHALGFYARTCPRCQGSGEIPEKLPAPIPPTPDQRARLEARSAEQIAFTRTQLRRRVL